PYEKHAATWASRCCTVERSSSCQRTESDNSARGLKSCLCLGGGDLRLHRCPCLSRLSEPQPAARERAASSLRARDLLRPRQRSAGFWSAFSVLPSTVSEAAFGFPWVANPKRLMLRPGASEGPEPHLAARSEYECLCRRYDA